MYKIKTMLKSTKTLVNNTSISLAEKLMPLVEEREKMIARMCEVIAENVDGFCLRQQETHCDCSDCDKDCAEQVYNYFEREVERETKNE